ncbi:unnamed protein product, partial [Prorocentrum cordatum]
MLRDAHARLLEPGATLVPRRVALRAVLVECAALAAADLPELRGAPWPLMLGQLGLAPSGGSGGAAARPLTQAWAAASIDFARLPDAGPVAAVAEVEATAAGSAHAVAWWWELDMGGGHRLSSWTDAEPPGGEAPLRHHWRPCLSFLAPRRVRVGDRLSRLRARAMLGQCDSEGGRSRPALRLRAVSSSARLVVSSWRPRATVFPAGGSTRCREAERHPADPRAHAAAQHGCGDAQCPGVEASCRW